MSDRRTHILETAIALFHKEGFWRTSTASIARAADIATGTLFNYFPTKSALIDAVYTTLKKEAAEAITEGFPHDKPIDVQLRFVWQAYIGWAVQNPVRFALMHQLKLSDLVSAPVQEAGNDQFRFAADVFRQAIAEDGVADVPVEFLMRLASAHLEASIAHCLAHNLEGAPREAFVETSYQLFWKSIAA